jgi:ADP-ribose pyrophosphatase YjhB (NUDIX family)
MPSLKRKVYAYITHADRLLVFRHPFHPEAGIQVPGGTLNDGERPEDGVMREAVEETGLTDLSLIALLGIIERDMSDYGLDQTHCRYFYHLRSNGNPPERWRHGELHPSDGSPAPIAFEFFWAHLPDGVPSLIADLDCMIPPLLRAMLVG